MVSYSALVNNRVPYGGTFGEAFAFQLVPG